MYMRIEITGSNEDKMKDRKVRVNVEWVRNSITYTFGSELFGLAGSGAL